MNEVEAVRIRREEAWNRSRELAVKADRTGLQSDICAFWEAHTKAVELTKTYQALAGI